MFYIAEQEGKRGDRAMVGGRGCEPQLRRDRERSNNTNNNKDYNNTYTNSNR